MLYVVCAVCFMVMVSCHSDKTGKFFKIAIESNI